MASKEQQPSTSGHYTSDFNTESQHIFAQVRSNKSASVSIAERDRDTAQADGSIRPAECGAGDQSERDLGIEGEQDTQFADLPATLERGGNSLPAQGDHEQAKGTD